MTLKATSTAVVKDLYTIHENYNTYKNISNTSKYVYGHNDISFKEKIDKLLRIDLVGFTYADNKYIHRHFKDITDKELVGIARTRVISQKIIELSETSTINSYHSRLNSNIYKNIFPETILNMEYILNIINNSKNESEYVIQENHNFELYDVVYKDSNGIYYKSQAINSLSCSVDGIITEVSSKDSFTVSLSGMFPYEHQSFKDTTILYLSDKYPGKIVHYYNIENKIYIPIAIYANNNIIINIQNGSSGVYLSSYEEYNENQNFENYTYSELKEVIDTIKGDVNEL